MLMHTAIKVKGGSGMPQTKVLVVETEKLTDGVCQVREKGERIKDTFFSFSKKENWKEVDWTLR